MIRAIDREFDSRGYHGRQARVIGTSAYMTGLVESGLRNLRYGDADSLGWRQERASLYKDPLNLPASVDRYFDEAEAEYRKGIRPGDLAQAAQGSAFPGRYAQTRSQALDLLRAGRGLNFPGGSGSMVPGRAPSIEREAVQPQAGISALVRALDAANEPVVPSAGGVAPPAFSAAPALPEGYQPVASGGGPAPPKPDLSELMALVQPGAGLPQSTLTPGTPDTAGGGGGSGPSSVRGFRIGRDANHGAKQLAEYATRGIYGSGERTPGQNAAAGGSATSDHLTTNRWASAVDAKYGTGKTIAKRLGVRGWKPGTYDRHVITVDGRRYSVQILENVEGHFDHTHVGIQRVR